jgi:thiamine-triphosphatase
MRSVRRAAALPLLLGSAVVRALSVGAAHGRIEVERKFVPGDLDELDERVSTFGGVCLGTQSFTDVYYDTPACTLTRRDMWLRCRDGAWELKVPTDADARRSGGERSVFREVEGTAAVNEALRALVVAAPDESGVSTCLDETLATMGAQPFAEFSTTRSKWKLGSCTHVRRARTCDMTMTTTTTTTTTCHVCTYMLHVRCAAMALYSDMLRVLAPYGRLDADVASFGHAVMEIEVMVEDTSEVVAAEDEIARVAELVGAKPLGACGGKLETYIRRKAPDVLSALIDEGILQADTES